MAHWVRWVGRGFLNSYPFSISKPCMDAKWIGTRYLDSMHGRGIQASHLFVWFEELPFAQERWSTSPCTFIVDSHAWFVDKTSFSTAVGRLVTCTWEQGYLTTTTTKAACPTFAFLKKNKFIKYTKKFIFDFFKVIKIYI